jgi:uncharacterized protein YbjT (DUF2867 family)
MKHILITGATGRVGSTILDLLPADYPIRAGLRSPKHLSPKSLFRRLELVPFDMEKPETFAAALEGISHVFLMWPPVKVEYVYEFIRAAEQAGVEHIVFLSIVLAGDFGFLPHRRIENCLESSAMHYTFLRASYFMQNLDSIHRAEIRELGELFIPAGNGILNLVDVRDVAEVAVKALTEQGHEDKVYVLVGSENLNFKELALRLTKVLGREIVYSNPNVLYFIWWMRRKRGYPLSLVLFMVLEYGLSRFKLGTNAVSHIPAILGRAPRLLDDYTRNYRSAWT